MTAMCHRGREEYCSSYGGSESEFRLVNNWSGSCGSWHNVRYKGCMQASDIDIYILYLLLINRINAICYNAHRVVWWIFCIIVDSRDQGVRLSWRLLPVEVLKWFVLCWRVVLRPTSTNKLQMQKLMHHTKRLRMAIWKFFRLLHINKHQTWLLLSFCFYYNSWKVIAVTPWKLSTSLQFLRHISTFAHCSSLVWKVHWKRERNLLTYAMLLLFMKH